MIKTDYSINAHFFENCPKEVLTLIIKEVVQKRIWGVAFSPLPLVSKRFYRICNTLISQLILPRLLKTIEVPPNNLSPLYQVQFLRQKMECKLEVGKGWEKKIHVKTRELLSVIQDDSFESLSKKWEEFLDCGVDCNAFSSSKRTPLLQVCEYSIQVGEYSIGADLMNDEREKVEARLLAMINLLLKKGADPNKQGCPSLPLMVILSQAPLSRDDALFAQAIVKKLCEYGANIHLIPVKDSYGFKLSSFAYAEKHYPALRTVLLTTKCR